MLAAFGTTIGGYCVISTEVLRACNSIQSLLPNSDYT